jgi:hypothetical protein
MNYAYDMTQGRIFGRTLCVYKNARHPEETT